MKTQNPPYPYQRKQAARLVANEFVKQLGDMLSNEQVEKICSIRQQQIDLQYELNNVVREELNKLVQVKELD